MCEIDDRAVALHSQGLFSESDEKEAFRQYLDGLLAMPSETEKAIREMEQEKRES